MIETIEPIPQETSQEIIQEPFQIMCSCDVDLSPLISTLELGFVTIVVFVGVVCGLILSKIVNWWKW